MTTRKRLDLLLIEKGLANNQAKAQALVLAGEVIVDDKRIDKPGTLVRMDAPIRLRSNSLPFVSRGGLKLKAAIERWPSPIRDAVCLDVGASTGGFTDVLLQAGAREVYAVDVGHNQLAYSLRMDPRVHVMERTHVLHIPKDALDPKPTIAVVDVSFISLEKVLPKIVELLEESGTIYALIKPQFEVKAEFLEKGGIVRDEKARLDVVHLMIDRGNQLGLSSEGFLESPIQGADGNIEYLVAFRK